MKHLKTMQRYGENLHGVKREKNPQNYFQIYRGRELFKGKFKSL